MTPTPTSLFERYQPNRRFFEVGFWLVFMGIQAAINSSVIAMDIERVHLDFAAWEPATWEWSSHVVVLMLVPAVIAFERVFPLYLGSLRRNVPWHFLGSLVFSVAHVTAMVAIRHLVYRWHGQHYDFGNWPHELYYEYLKDWRSYLSILMIVSGYRLLILRLQGEARLLDAPDDQTIPTESIQRPERFLVRKLGKEFLVSASDIEFVQASGNYVNLHVRGRDYPLRATMAGIEPRLDPARFVRVHRGYIVNLDNVSEIEPLETGDARLTLKDGTKVPCSRRYRPALRAGNNINLAE